MIATWEIIVGIGLIICVSMCLFFNVDIAYCIRGLLSFLFFLITLPFFLLHVIYCHWKRK
jgi:hypothetical protein